MKSTRGINTFLWFILRNVSYIVQLQKIAVIDTIELIQWHYIDIFNFSYWSRNFIFFHNLFDYSWSTVDRELYSKKLQRNSLNFACSKLIKISSSRTFAVDCTYLEHNHDWMMRGCLIMTLSYNNLCIFNLLLYENLSLVLCFISLSSNEDKN